MIKGSKTSKTASVLNDQNKQETIPKTSKTAIVLN